MPTLSVRTTRIVVVSLVALATIASGVASYVVGRHYDERREADAVRSLGLGVRPTPLWTLDVQRVATGPGDTLLSVATPDTNTSGYGFLVDAADNLIAAVGRPRAYTEVADVTLVGIGRTDGAPIWRRPVGPITSCTGGPLAGSIACWSPTRVIVVDTATGRVRGQADPDFTVSGVTVAGDATYVSGTRGTGPAASVVLATGTVGAPTASVRTITDAGPGASISDVAPDRRVFIVRAAADGDIGFASAVYSLDTGTRRFAADGIVTTIGDTLFRAETYPQGIERLLTDDGTQVATQRLSLPDGSFRPQVTATPFAPIVMGNGVFDPRSGALLWRDPVLDWGKADGGIAPAVVGPTLIAASLDGNLIGFDARSGRRIWTTPWPAAFVVRSGISDGRFFVFGDASGMHSLDAVTGRIVWSVVSRSPSAGTLALTAVSGSGGDIVRAEGDSLSVWRARKGEQG
ncbi:PQQ-binding-like beta-propeller repeat protein [Williamsia sp. MIQD14]|uniref:outer membrane protein assembly factor BamB family protein n=1 Tax=Williamsia sp. MIQD14 TaxID=3425703 RepID=UPI003DA0A582